jgi:hypothetical protein
MRGIRLTIVLKQKFPVGAMAPLPPPAGAHAEYRSPPPPGIEMGLKLTLLVRCRTRKQAVALHAAG